MKFLQNDLKACVINLRQVLDVKNWIDGNSSCSSQLISRKKLINWSHSHYFLNMLISPKLYR